MKWKKEDLRKYVQAKEYIDSIITPLIPFQLSGNNDLEKNAFQSEALTILSGEIEKELTGRVMLTPAYNYLKSANKESEIVRLNNWVEDTKKQPFSHFFFITFDSSWKKLEQSLNGTLLWLPGMQTGDLNSKETHALIRDQVEQISELIRSYWQ